MDQSGLRWPQWPVTGAVGAGRHDELAAAPDSFTLTPSAQAEQDRAAPEWYRKGGFPPGTFQDNEEVPGAGPE
jgi:hypothetical protein